mgnify:FL=1
MMSDMIIRLVLETYEFWSKWNRLCDFIEDEFPDIAKESRI